jgi:transcriptional regulator with XRE-family HTH domain
VRGIELRRARIDKGLSLRDVEAATTELGCKVDASNLAKAEAGMRGKIGPHKIPVLLKVLGLTIEDLIPDEDAA